MKRPGRYSGALLLSGARDGPKPPPPISQHHPHSATHPDLDTPPGCRGRAALEASGEHQVPSVHGTLDGGQSAGEVKAGAFPLVGTQQEVPQHLTPEGKISRRHSRARRRR